MEIFTKEQLKFVMQIILKKQPLEKLSKKGINTLSYYETMRLLDHYLSKNDFYAFKVVFGYIPKNITFDEQEELLRKYLLRSNHYEHENMIAPFYSTYRENLKNIDVLVELINSPPVYFKEEDRDVIFINKCLEALGRQKYPESYNAIKQISEITDNEMTKKIANYMINNWDN